MSTSPDRLDYLLQQYAANNCTRKELLELLQAIDAAGYDEVLHSTMLNIWQNISNEEALPVIDKEQVFDQIMAAVATEAPTRKRWIWLKAAAAVFILALGSIVFFYANKKNSQLQNDLAHNDNLRNKKVVIGNKTVLTLADGSELILDSIQNGTRTQQENTSVRHEKGKLTYTAAANPATTLAYNILTVPAGSKYEIVLPDGSHVWLNAASAIRYPVAFSGPERKVEVTGEAYFEVAKDPQKPFRVTIFSLATGESRGETEVLGTHFNIKAYDGEGSIKTTLLEGSVKVIAPIKHDTADSKDISHLTSHVSRILSPGQQASISSQSQKSHTIQVQTVNVAEAIAWKKGELILNNVTMDEAARIMERWYNVQFEFRNPKLTTCRITVPFLKGEPVQEAMDVISGYIGFTWKKEDGKIILSGSGCQ